MENERDEQKNVLHSSSDERSSIEHYFDREFRYDTIVKKKNIEEKKVEKCHVISMNSRTLKRGLHEYGLRRRNEVYSEHEVRELIKREIEGPSSLLGYRAMWRKLRTSYNIVVPRHTVIVYESLIHRHLPFERPGSCRVDHTVHPVETQVHVDGYDKQKSSG